MDYKKLSPAEIQQLYDVGGFFVLNNLPLASQFTIDGRSSITGPRFQGLKLVPPGFHLITFVPGPKPEPSGDGNSPTKSDNAPANTHIGQQIKRGLIRFFKPQEIVIKSYEDAEENFHQPGPDEPEMIITSRDHMKSLDSQLAPYPIDRYSNWKSLTNHINPSLVKQIFGLTSSNEVIIDSLMSNDEITGRSEKFDPSRQRTLSDTFPQHQNLPTGGLTQTLQTRLDTPKAGCTRWPTIDLKKSWPKDCVGEELTRWSRDKSWLFHQFILHECKKKLDGFLGLVQLSFITFLHLHSFQSLETYQALLTLLSRSTVQELSNFDQRYKTLLVQVMVQLRFQLDELATDFFVEMQDPQLENWIFKTIDLLRIQLNQIISRGELELMKEMMERHWPALQQTCKRFDWNVKPLKKRQEVVESEDEEDEDDESDEDEDNKPVVVET
ncbi:hypothetical protein CROQUDRAFT_653733 [Cronartium quercuum f. sp. fusiforme G11]|uniref:Uncharacterized protein n=1 Tax=Cronartium quercuum f. sp. fusiforme G11 TaxID=708437 RepID=A0A9P6NLS2_9BASI|nr:hypothetical protein CROQUDRAFT_653733 [Cronartium quercuum f. sp. fusiforme G11]